FHLQVHEAIKRDGRAGFAFDEHAGVADIACLDRRKPHSTRRILPGDARWYGQGDSFGRALYRRSMRLVCSHGSLQGFETSIRDCNCTLILQVSGRIIEAFLRIPNRTSVCPFIGLCGTFLTYLLGGWVFRRYPVTRTTGYLVITSGAF